MASSSSSSSSAQIKYDVFLSFRGEDTRENFTGHLYSALCRNKINTFIDYELRRGDEISPSLLDAIKASRISIVIFSEGFASSRWCLIELVKILECKNKYGRIVIPVFYRVDPSDVRNQTGIFGDAFLKLEERFEERLDKLQKWRIALRDAADLSGFDSRVIRDESILVGKIVEDVLKRLNDMFPSDYTKGLVGVELKVRQIERLLRLGSKDILSVGIWGIGGIGKTTIANAIFNKISCGFEGSYFIRNVREESERIGGLAQLQRELFSALLEDKNVKIDVLNICSSFRCKRLNCKKVLIVLDDVTCSEQIELLIGSVDLFGLGSRIIITTRDKQVLKNCRKIEICEMKELTCDAALELFSRHAFGKDKPCVGYEELSNKVVKYAHGVPLALTILGRFLVGRSKEDWKSAINRLQRIPHKDIQKVLKISYDDLEDEEQNIFLDIACFLKGEDKDCVIQFLEACGFAAQIGMAVLVDKALITISSNEITMHDLLREMGREIVRQESVNNPGKRSRLWHHKDVHEILTYNMGTEAIQGISLDMSNVKEMHLNPHTFTKMRKLRFLKFYGENKCRISHFEDPVFTEMRYLHWDGYPLKSLPSNIQSEIIFALQMHDSIVKKLWDGVKNLVNLKQIDLKGCKQLEQLPNLSRAPNLESLCLEGCTSLIEIDSSMQHLNKLVILDIRDCISLRSLPTSLHMESLKKLYLSGCSNLERVPNISSCNVEELLLNGTAIEELPSSIGCLSRLVTLDIRECRRLKSLPSSLCELKSLQYLYLSGCTSLQSLPDNVGDLKALKELQAERIALGEVPSSIVYLNNLANLSFKGFRGQKLMGFLLPISLPFRSYQRLMTLNLSDCGIVELPECLGQLSSLKDLCLDKNYFDRIPKSIIFLSKLRKLNISYCERLKSLPELPGNLYQMDATYCSSLVALSHLSILFRPRPSFESEVFKLSNCFKLDRAELRQIVKHALQGLLLKVIIRSKLGWNNMNPDKMNDQTVFGQIYYPGSEIPEWFKYQSIGSSIILRLPLVSVYNIFVGIAFCAIVAFGDHHYNKQHCYLSAEYMLKTKDTHGCVSGEEKYTLFDRRIGIDYVGSDHVLFGYYFIKFLNCEYYINDEVFFQFHLEDEERNRMECCKVKKCGIHLFYSRGKRFGEWSETRFGEWSGPRFGEWSAAR